MQKILAMALLLCATVSGANHPWATPAEAERMTQELQDFLRGAEVRYPGSPGNLAMEEKINKLFADSGRQHGEIKFRTACFIPGETTLSFSNQPSIRLSAMHPTLFRPGNFKDKEFSVPLVYLGRGANAELERFKGARLKDALVLMDFNCGTEWMRLLRFGVKGFIFIEPEVYERDEALAKLYNTEVAVPRFLVKRADGAILKTAGPPDGKVRVKTNPARWENKFLRDFWVLIPGSSPDLGHEVAVIVAPLDSNCIVPEMATGAQAGANLFLLTRLLNDFARKPLARSVLLVAVNAHVLWNQGERMLAWHTLASEEAVEVLRNEINNDLRIQQLLIDHYRRLSLDSHRPADEDLLVSWRSLVDESTDKNISVKDSLVTLVKRDLNHLKNEQLLLAQQQLPDEEIQRHAGKFAEQREKYVRVLALFNKFGFRTKLSDLSGEEIRILKGYVREVINYNTVCAELNKQDLLLEKQNDAVREAVKGRKISFVISLALDWNSPQIGFSAGKSAYWSRRWGANSLNIAEQLAEVRQGKANLLADTLTQRGALPYEYYFLPHQDGASLAFQRASHMAAFDLFNVFTSNDKIFLPSDTFENLNKTNFANEAAFLTPYLRALFNAQNITSPSELDYSEIWRGWTSIKGHRVKTFKFDELSASVVPELPVPNTTAVFIDQEPDVYRYPLQNFTVIGDVCSSIILLTDQRATTALYGPYMSTRSSVNNLTALAFHCDDDFVTVDHTIDAGEIQKKVNPGEYVFRDPVVTLALFEGCEFPIYPIADSSLIGGTPIFIKGMIPLTGKGNSSPRKYGLTSIGSVLSLLQARASAGAPAAFYFTPTEKIKLITDEKRLALNAGENDCEGQGYGSAQELGSDFFRAVTRDMAILNQARVKKLGEVADDLVREFIARGDRCRQAFSTALAENDYLQYLRKLYEGLGAQVKAYEQNRQITNDMLKAVVVYMALLLPFCFFIQKLLFNFVKIEHEMAMFALFFVATFLIFQVIHPAFRVTQAAGVIFIAFIMGTLGLFVINILRGRFEGEMQLIFRSYLSGTMDEAGYSTVTQKAMLIGVNNMKRRRIRTILTTMTIVLIAFAMLSFTSISKKINPTIICKNKTPPYTGFMFHWPGKSQMEEATFAVIRDLFSSYGEIAVRRWKTMDNNAPFHVAVNNGKATMVEAILGLTTAEDGFLSKFPIVAGRFFSADDAQEALISSQMAANLAIDPAKLDGIVINCQGYDLRVVGIYDDEKIKNLKDLNDIPILPIKNIVSQLSSSLSSGFGTEEIPKEELDDLGMLLFVDPLSLLIVPGDLTRRLQAFPYSVSVKMKDNAPVWPLMDTLLTATMAKFYLSSLMPFTVGNENQQTVAAGAYYVGSNYKTSVGGLAVLLIPLFIASTIILNTMLGSVYERKKEIAVYNAIGLNPHHIGLFFLAESFVYGVIGSVGGYLIGQLMSSALKYSGLVKGINFNYSSLSVAYVIILTLAIVLLSTIYPAMAAVRTAVPSGKRNWSMPPHKDNNMEVVFPFIYQPRIAAGILAYLEEYFARFTEVSIGDLIATRTLQKRGRDEKGRECFQLGYHIALAPYDLGVTENLKFDLAYDDYVQAYRLILDIERMSGQDVNWVTTNRPFLEQLRKYLMRWRNLDPGQQTLYVKQSADLMVPN